MFQKMYTESFWTYVQLFEEFYYRSNFYFLWLNLLSELAQINCPFFKRVKNFFEKFVFTWSDLLSAAKYSKSVHPELFLTNSKFFEEC